MRPQTKNKKKDKLSDRLEEFRKRKKEEDEAMCLIEEMRKNLEAAQHKAEQRLCSALWEYVDTFDKDRGRPKAIMAKLWQLMQNRDTKNLNLDKDLEEILSKMKQIGGSEADTTRRPDRLVTQVRSDSLKRMYVTRGLGRKYAATIGSHHHQASHSDTCRDRIRAELEKSEEGREYLAREEARVDARETGAILYIKPQTCCVGGMGSPT